MNKFKILFCLIVTMALTSCEHYIQEYVILLKNDSNYKINSYAATTQESAYPDTLIIENKFAWATTPGNSISFAVSKPWEEVLEKLPKDTLSIFIFDSDTLENNSWDTIKGEYKILKRYDLSIENIQLLNYDIPYPPTEVMKDMKMYPPYSE